MKRIRTKPVQPEDTIGKTVSKVKRDKVEGPYGSEPRVILYFEDGTRTAFVLQTGWEKDAR